jgi:pyruvate/2-oxoglutarate dehydrogenase complex dihydrolipoamide acyltransferase (E2) component
MTEGGITAWKKKEGEKFTTGDVLLELETDKGKAIVPCMSPCWSLKQLPWTWKLKMTASWSRSW